VSETETTYIDDSDTPGDDGPPVGLYLLVMSPETFLTVALPPSGIVTIGRSAECTIVLDDAQASRRHAALEVTGPASVTVEDLGSANGTQVHDQPVPPGQKVPVVLGEAIVVGRTVLMVQQKRAGVGLRRLWSHVAFEGRLEEECLRAGASGRSFALLRLQLGKEAGAARAVPLFVRVVPRPHMLAAYGPRDYEVLLVDVDAAGLDHHRLALADALRAAHIEARIGVAVFPADGRTGDALLSRANQSLRAGPRPLPSPVEIGSEIERVRQLAARVASSNLSVLILGETGVGKEVLAEAIHRQSPRRDRPFVKLNCAGIPEGLFESELFGHERGAFTGAERAKVGLLETANGGTILLDEVGELPLALQAKLLRVIEQREVLPVGGVKARPLDVRFVAATNRDLEVEILRGTFRGDLFFRLAGVTLALPPLRERLEELPSLAEAFIRQAWTATDRTPPRLSPEALRLLRGGYRWPGNIRELKNVIERALVLLDGDEIGPACLPVEKLSALPPPLSIVARGTGGPAAAAAGPGAPLLPFARPPLGSLPQGRDQVAEGAEGHEADSEDGEDSRDSAPLSASQRGARPPAWPLGGSSAGSLPRGYDPEAPALPPGKAAERRRILDALAACAGNQSRAAQLLGMPRRTFVSKLDAYRIARPRKPPGA
jgi:DNA-binding NtrC family response regulator